MVVSDYIAQWLEQKGITHAFGIIGAGNAALFDAIARHKKTEIVCVHHEQAAVMAASSWVRIRHGGIGVAFVTTGGGSANAVTGVIGAWMDSVPVMVISGNEELKHCESRWRGWGVQGFDSVAMVKGVTKWAKRMQVSRQTRYLDEAYQAAFKDRPGPVWLDIPRDIQTHEIPQDI